MDGFPFRRRLSPRLVFGCGDRLPGLQAEASAESPLYRLVERHLEELLRVWPERFARRHGPLRAVVERVLREFLRCGLLEHGFARLWCGGNDWVKLGQNDEVIPYHPSPGEALRLEG